MYSRISTLKTNLPRHKTINLWAILYQVGIFLVSFETVDYE